MAKQIVQVQGVANPEECSVHVVREIPRDAAQRRNWAFCFVIDFFGNFFAAPLSKQSKAAKNGRF